ncbi:MAG: membrane complex biogenesis BtpA family protein [Verrucomicrobiales bacterium]|mgnify:CR=1 FL=1|jgi:membrane complex biogenesis BtpA family protein
MTLNGTLIGMIHVGALPGTPLNALPIGEIIDLARDEAITYRDCGIDAIMIENMHDRPYIKGGVGPEITAAMTAIAYEVKAASDLPCGIQILAAANCEALAVAHATGLEFIRAEGFVFGHLADEGLIESDAGELLRFRHQIGAENVQILTDIKKKHSSHAITADLDVGETAKAAAYFLSDGLILTGKHTGEEPNIADFEAARENAPELPLIAGSGITPENCNTYLGLADALIVGSSLKLEGNWQYPVDPRRVEALVSAAKN